MFYSGNMWAVSTTQRTLAPEQSTLKNSREVSGWRPESEWQEQVNLIVASDIENIPSSVFMIHAEEKKAVIQLERFSNFNRLVNTVKYVQRALNKHKPATLVVSIWDTHLRKGKRHNLQVTTARTVWRRDEISQSWKGNSKRRQNCTILNFLTWRKTYSSQRQNRQK